MLDICFRFPQTCPSRAYPVDEVGARLVETLDGGPWSPHFCGCCVFGNRLKYGFPKLQLEVVRALQRPCYPGCLPRWVHLLPLKKAECLSPARLETRYVTTPWALDSRAPPTSPNLHFSTTTKTKKGHLAQFASGVLGYHCRLSIVTSSTCQTAELKLQHIPSHTHPKVPNAQDQKLCAELAQ